MIQDLQERIRAAMKAGDKARVSTLRSLMNDLKNAGIEKKGAGGAGDSEAASPADLLDEEERLAVLRKAAKQRREAIEQYEAGGRGDLVEKEGAELAVIEEFLPQPLTPEQTEALVAAVVEETGAGGMADMGRVMKEAQARAAGRADGSALAQLVRKRLEASG